MNFSWRRAGYRWMLFCGLALTIHGRAQTPQPGTIGVVATPRAQGNPPMAQTVEPGSGADAAGVKAGDVLMTVDGAPVMSVDAFNAAVGRHGAGDRLDLMVYRGGKFLTLSVAVRTRPALASVPPSPPAPAVPSPVAPVPPAPTNAASEEVLRSSVMVDGARRGIIVTRPRGAGRFPAVMLMGGLGCYSVDNLAPTNPYARVLAALRAEKFVTLRVEKTGEGESEGPACTDDAATVAREADGYVEGLKALKAYDFVDGGKVFVFAHSLGPLVGAVALPRFTGPLAIRGFIAAETIGRSWFEYTLENLRRQLALLGTPPDEVDAAVRPEEICAHDFFVLRHSVKDVAQSSPRCKEMIDSYAGVPGPYMQEIAAIDLGRQWKTADIPVLVLYGTSDPATSADESRYLVQTINRMHPGRASYVELPNMGHDFALYDSQADFLKKGDAPGKVHPFDQELMEAVLRWLEQQLTMAGS